jgi:hypothetical protein
MIEIEPSRVLEDERGGAWVSARRRAGRRNTGVRLVLSPVRTSQLRLLTFSLPCQYATFQDAATGRW